MNSENNSNRDAGWTLMLTATISIFVVLYVVSSGPMKIGFEKIGSTFEAHELVYAPLRWLADNTSTRRGLNWYWVLFPTQAEKDSPRALALSTDPPGINRHLGVAD